MAEIPAEIAEVVDATGFSGAISVAVDGRVEWEAAAGLASRTLGVPNRPGTPYAVASATKTVTALVVLSLVEAGVLRLDQPVREVLGTDLPLVDDTVTVEQLLAHRSGIGDYLAEDGDWSPDRYVLPVPVLQLDSVPAYLPLLDGRPQAFAPGERFAYCNSGFVVLALVAERVAGRPLARLVQDRVAGPAGLTGTVLARTDERPAGAAEGYVEVDGHWRSHLPVLPVAGGGDGGLYAVPGDLARLWTALFAGRVVAPDLVAELVRPRSDVPREGRRYGLGLWLHRTRPVVMMEGCDAGVSVRSVHDPETGRTVTTVGTTSAGAWPVTAALERVYGLD